MGTINQYFLYLIIVLWQSLKLLRVKVGDLTFPSICGDKGQFILKEGKVNKMIYLTQKCNNKKAIENHLHWNMFVAIPRALGDRRQKNATYAQAKNKSQKV